MKRALVIGASGGIGAALSTDLSAKGWEVTDLSRRDDGLDITDEANVVRLLQPLAAPYDRILVATGALEIDGTGPEKSLKAFEPQAFAAQIAVNALGPLLILKHALRLLPRDSLTQFAALSARVGSIGDNRLGGWYSYRAAKAALNQLIHTAAIEVARTHPQAAVVALHPGTVATAFGAAHRGSHRAVSPREAAENLNRVMDTLTPMQTGGFFDYAGREIAW